MVDDQLGLSDDGDPEDDEDYENNQPKENPI